MVEVQKLVAVRQMCANGEARRIRQTANLTLAEIGGDVLVTPTTVQRWETGQRSPRGEQALRYYRTLARLRRLDIHQENS